MREVYVTGLGAVSALGLGLEEQWQALREQRDGLGMPRYLDTRLEYPVGEVKHPNEALISRLSLEPSPYLSRTALLGMLAARDAVLDAGLEDLRAVGLISGTSVGGMDLSERFYADYRQSPSDAGDVRLTTMHTCGASTDAIAHYLGLGGYTSTISTACSSAANAIILGARLIAQGHIDSVVVGGTDALCAFTLNGFGSLLILDKAPCRPMTEGRSGLNLGEGAGYLVLQAAEVARRTPYCRIAGYANINEAYHQTGSSPDGDGAYRSMRLALERGGITPEEVDFVNLHGTGTPTNDLSESHALRRLFADRIPAFSSLKPYIGHTLGASEGIEAVYTILAMARGAVLPHLRFDRAIEQTALVPATSYREGVSLRYILSNAFGFGGSNSTLLFAQL